MAKRMNFFDNPFYANRLHGRKVIGYVSGIDSNRSSGQTISMLDKEPEGLIIHTRYNEPVAVTMTYATYKSLTTNSSTIPQSKESKTHDNK